MIPTTAARTMPCVIIARDHSTARVNLDSLEMDTFAQVQKLFGHHIPEKTVTSKMSG